MDLRAGPLRLARNDVIERDVDGSLPLHELGQRLGDRVDGIRTTVTARLMTSLPAGVRDNRTDRLSAGSDVHSIVTAPLVKPAPNATIVTLSPTSTRPSFTASASASGTDAADVFP